LENHSELFPDFINVDRFVGEVGVVEIDMSLSMFKERKNVDFPQPEGPIIATTSPFFTVVLMPFKTTCFP
jgi:hypothetical protein